MEMSVEVSKKPKNRTAFRSSNPTTEYSSQVNEKKQLHSLVYCNTAHNNQNTELCVT